MPMLGGHAVNYMFMHYFTATSTVLVANAYSRFSNDARGFVRHLTAMGLAPRHAAYLWTVISPEIMGPPRRSSPPVTRPSGVRASPEVEGSTTDQGEHVTDQHQTEPAFRAEPAEPSPTRATGDAASDDMDMEIEYDDSSYDLEAGDDDHTK